MGMHLSTSINHKDRALRQLAQVFSWVKISGMKSDVLNGKVLEIMKTLEKCPEWVRAYVRGWTDATRRGLEQELVFFYTMQDGKLVSTHRDRPDYYEKMGLGPKEVYDLATHSGHYWVRQRWVDGKWEERLVPYFVSEMEDGSKKAGAGADAVQGPAVHHGLPTDPQTGTA
jgi:hypothetical protein